MKRWALYVAKKGAPYTVGVVVLAAVVKKAGVRRTFGMLAAGVLDEVDALRDSLR